MAKKENINKQMKNSQTDRYTNRKEGRRKESAFNFFSKVRWLLKSLLEQL